jgi:tripartite-type tricarboxylate transporter receptor subunit TctC
VVPYAPGGSTDFTARLLAQHLSAEFGQQFVVDNRAGAVGTIGANAVARARPDGHTLLVMPNTNYAMVPHMMQLPYDAEKGLAPVCLLATNAQFLCVHPSVRARTAAEFVALAKAQPGKLTYSSSGAGSSAHLAAELFLSMAALDITHVPYRGGAPAAQALIANEVQMSMVDAVTALPFIKNVWPAPSASSSTIQSDQSTPTYPVSGHRPGQDGDPRVPVLITTTASSATSCNRFPEHRSTVRPSRFHHPQTSSAARAG